MLITVGIGLLATRLLVRNLGFEDFGLLTALGASGTLLSTFTSSLTRSAQRHLAYEIGRGDFTKLAVFFNSTLVIFIALAIVLWLFGYTITSKLLSIMDIPENRFNAAYWVYQFTLLQITVSVLSTPFRAVLYAHQSLILLAIGEVIAKVADLAVVISLSFGSWDRLVSYSFLSFLLLSIGSITPLIICWRRYPESVPRLNLFGWQEAREIGSFAGWSLVNQIVWDLRSHGSVVLINSFYGPIINASYALAMRVAGYQNQVAFTILNAISPAIIKIEGQGSNSSFLALVCLSGKYSTLASSFIFVPLIIELDEILKLWLGNYPSDASSFTRLMILMTLALFPSAGHHIAMEAKGDLAGISLWTSIPQILGIGIAGLVFYIAHPSPLVLPIILTVVGALLGLVIRPWYVGKKIELPYWQWCKFVLWPSALVLFFAGGSAYLVHCLLPLSAWRILAVAGINGTLSLVIIWFFGMLAWERQHFLRVLRRFLEYTFRRKL